jgi:hypothetical protein
MRVKWAILGALILLGVAAAPVHALITSTPFFCGPGNAGLALTCTGTVSVDDVLNQVTLTFNTFDAPGTTGVIDTIGIQLPGSAAFDAATTNALATNAGYTAGAGNLSFEAELACDPSCPSGKGEASLPFSFIFAYTGTDFTATDVTALANRTGECDGFHALWGCIHPFRLPGTVTSEFVPLQVAGQVIQTPEPGILLLLGSGLFGFAVAARKRRGR